MINAPLSGQARGHDGAPGATVKRVVLTAAFETGSDNKQTTLKHLMASHPTVSCVRRRSSLATDSISPPPLNSRGFVFLDVHLGNASLLNFQSIQQTTRKISGS